MEKFPTAFAPARPNKEPPAPLAGRTGAEIVTDGGGLRYAEGKCRVELIPPEWPWALGMVLTRGAIKYDDRNWERGMAWSYMVGSTLRHLFKFMTGERYDKESGNHHLAHAAWNCLALMSYDVRGLWAFNDLGTPRVPWSDPRADILERTYTSMGPELMAKAVAKQNAKAPIPEGSEH